MDTVGARDAGPGGIAQLRGLRSCSLDSPPWMDRDPDGIHLFSYLFLGRSCRSFPAEIRAKTSKLRSPRCICKPFDDVRMIWCRRLWIWWDEARLSMRRAKLMAPPGIFMMFYMPAVESEWVPEGPTSPYSIPRSWHILWSTRPRPQGSLLSCVPSCGCCGSPCRVTTPFFLGTGLVGYSDTLGNS